MIRRLPLGLYFLLYVPTLALIAALGVALGSCTTPPPTGPTYVRPVPDAVRDGNRPGQPSRGPRLSSVRTEPNLRIRIAMGAESAALDATGSLTIGPAHAGDADGARPRLFPAPVTIRREAGGAFLITDGRGRTVRWALPALLIRADDDALITLGERRYPGMLVAFPSPTRGRFDLVNHVPIETYLPGVLEKELYASWEPETFRAQAIAARSYALWERTLVPGRHYDLESTQASQVYGGAATNPKAIAAVRDTRGRVLVHDGRIVPAFYSAAHGTRMQDARHAFPNRVEDIEPLRGREVGRWDAGSSRHRWGPFERDTATLSRRIAAWGRANKHGVAALGTLRRVEITRTSPTGRPAVFTLTDAGGRRYNMAPESFRFACNYIGGGQPKLDKDATLWSSDVQVAVAGNAVRFFDGRGFGHGVGLSQWGAQAMAKAGRTHAQILAAYYPGSRIERAYR